MTITVQGPNGATVEFPDGMDAETIHKEMSKAFGVEQKPSGALPGIVQGVSNAASGTSETLKDFFGVSSPTLDNIAKKTSIKDYVPADVFHGSINPLNWSPSQIPQALSEAAPSLGAAIAAGTTAAKLTPGGPIPKLIAGVAVPAAMAWMQHAGKQAKEDAVARTGNPDAQPEKQDLVRAGVTSGVADTIGSLPVTRLFPGANKLGSVGMQGVIDAGKKYLGTTAAMGAGAGVADAVNQVGNTIGTDKGVQYDPERAVNATLGGTLQGGAFAAPRFLMGDVPRAVGYREFGGENTDASAGLAKRLDDTQQKLGNAKGAYSAITRVQGDLRSEIGDVAKEVGKQAPLSSDAQNALDAAKGGKPITMKDVGLIERETAGTPDGDNATHLLRQAYLAQQLAKKGSFDTTNQKWAGGVSGIMDKNLPWITNPAKLAVGSTAAALGFHMLGTMSPLWGGTAYGAYGATRLADALSGARSPAKTFVDHFNALNAQTRLPASAPPQTPQAPTQGPAQPWGPVPPASGPTGPQVAPPSPPPGPAAPWGPVPPMAGPTGPQVAPPAPPAPAAPPISPMALMMLKAQLKANPHAVVPPAPPAPTPAPAPEVQGPPAPTDAQLLARAVAQNKARLATQAYLEKVRANSTPPEPPAPPAPPPVDPMAGMPPVPKPPKPVPTDPVTGIPRVALAQLRARMQDAPEGPASPAVAPAPPANPVDALAAKIPSAAAANIMAQANAALKAKPAAPALAAQSTPGKVRSIADILSNVNAQAAAPAKITKSDGKVETVQAPALTQATSDNRFEGRNAYRPLSEDEMPYKRGTPHSDIANSETKAAFSERPDVPDPVKSKYRQSILDALSEKQSAADELSLEHPAETPLIHDLLDQLINRTGKDQGRELAQDAIAHYAAQMKSPGASQAVKNRYSEKALDRMYPKSSKQKKASGETQGRKAKGKAKAKATQALAAN